MAVAGATKASGLHSTGLLALRMPAQHVPVAEQSPRSGGQSDNAFSNLSMCHPIGESSHLAELRTE